MNAIRSAAMPAMCLILSFHALGDEQRHGDEQKSSLGRTLRFAGTPVVIDQPGHYVLDRNWEIRGSSPIMEISADDVVVDLRGFAIEITSISLGILINGDNVTVRDGKIDTAGADVLISYGDSTLIENMELSARLDMQLLGDNSVMRNSALAGRYCLGLVAARGVIEGNRFDCTERCFVGINADDTVVRNNRFRNKDDGESQPTNTVVLSGDRMTFENNYIEVDNVDENALFVDGREQAIINNQFRVNGESGTAIFVQGLANVLKNNIATHSVSGSRWQTGLEFFFLTSDNFYGDNEMEATMPFVLNGTTQTDWGDNVGF